jgi:hypothetical protein
MDNICNTKYDQFKNILAGCRSILDAYYFADIYAKRHPEMRNIIYSMINGKRYELVFDYITMKTIISDTKSTNYQEEALEIVDKISKKTTDQTQLKTLNRLCRTKPNKSVGQTENSKSCNVGMLGDNSLLKHISNDKSKDITTTKPCPHCGHTCTANIGTFYIVCGYGNIYKGYDWDGCRKDWCFQCKKILCKTWDLDNLFVDENCIHNNECCKKHAQENNYVYPDDYCQCNNEHVQRGQN